MLRPENWRGRCVVCKEDFAYPDFKCKKLPGNHRVESRAYFHMGGSNLSNVKDRRTWGPQMVLHARPQILDKESGKLVDQQSIMVQFQPGGTLQTDNPEEQFYLETRCPAVGWGDAGRKQWESIYLTTEQRQQLTSAELAATERKLAETNSLLAETQRRVASKGVRAEA